MALPYQGDAALINFILHHTVGLRYNDVIVVSAHFLRDAVKGTIPTVVDVVGIEDLLSPSVENGELNYAVEIKTYRVEDIITTIAIRGEGCRDHSVKHTIYHYRHVSCIAAAILVHTINRVGSSSEWCSYREVYIRVVQRTIVRRPGIVQCIGSIELYAGAIRNSLAWRYIGELWWCLYGYIDSTR